MINKCPINPPKLLSVKSTKIICTSCGSWVGRYPTFSGSDDYWQCERCGCTYLEFKNGRPYGKKSKEWEAIVILFNETFYQIREDEFDTIICNPPLEAIDHELIIKWLAENRIY